MGNLLSFVSYCANVNNFFYVKIDKLIGECFNEAISSEQLNT